MVINLSMINEANGNSCYSENRDRKKERTLVAPRDVT